MPVGGGVDSNHGLAQKQLGRSGQADHRHIGAHLHDGVDIVAIELFERVATHLIGGVGDLYRARPLKTKITDDGEAAVLIEPTDLVVGHREVRRKEGDAFDFVGIECSFGGEGTARHINTSTFTHHIQIFLGAFAAIPKSCC